MNPFTPGPALKLCFCYSGVKVKVAPVSELQNQSTSHSVTGNEDDTQQKMTRHVSYLGTMFCRRASLVCFDCLLV